MAQVPWEPQPVSPRLCRSFLQLSMASKSNMPVVSGGGGAAPEEIGECFSNSAGIRCSRRAAFSKGISAGSTLNRIFDGVMRRFEPAAGGRLRDRLPMLRCQVGAMRSVLVISAHGAETARVSPYGLASCRRRRLSPLPRRGSGGDCRSLRLTTDRKGQASRRTVSVMVGRCEQMSSRDAGSLA